MARRTFNHHKAQLNAFVDETISEIMQRISDHSRDLGYEAPSNDPIEDSLSKLLEPLLDRYDLDVEGIAITFAHHEIPKIVDACRIDAERYKTEDPALEDLEEVFYASNGFWATVAYRIANTLLRLEVPLLPRAVSSIAHSRTGVDIHPGATISPGLFIDHGTGIAIGCTAVIHANVNLYNGVVLGTRSKPRKKTDQNSNEIVKRHPTIQSNVSLYTSAFVGGDVVIGAHSIIGAFAFVCSDIPVDTVVPGKTESKPIEDRPAEKTSNENIHATSAASGSDTFFGFLINEDFTI